MSLQNIILLFCAHMIPWAEILRILKDNSQVAIDEEWNIFFSTLHYKKYRI
jgi:hypothetical protein